MIVSDNVHQLCSNTAKIKEKLKNHRVIIHCTWMRPNSVRDLPNCFRLIACFTVCATTMQMFTLNYNQPITETS